jgi:UDP-glucuronate decarboxylase
MRILVAGGAGFIGSHLCKRLLNLGHQVIALDNLFTGSLDNIEVCIKNSKFEFVHHDITEPIFIKVDKIINLACPASPVHYQREPIFTMKTNVIGTLNLADLSSRLKIPILHASTSEIYGDPKVNPQPEDYWGNVNPYGVRSCYDEGKRAAESLLHDFRNKLDLDARIARIFNTYGPSMQFNDGRVLSNFVYQALSQQPLTIYGDGNQTRSLCYIEDLLDGLISMMNYNGTLSTPINLGNPENYSILEIANLVIRLSNSKSSIVFKKLPEDDPKIRKPDISKARKLLSWTPKITLENGLNLMIQDFSNRINQNKIC